MFSEYIQAALERAKYDTLEDGSYVATGPGLQGVIAVGDSFEECRKDLIEVIEDGLLPGYSGDIRFLPSLVIP